MGPVRTANYDNIATGYDRRYDLHEYAGVRETLLNFVGGASAAAAIAEVGCGTGHWLQVLHPQFLAGVEPSGAMIGYARTSAPHAHLVRGAAERLPWRDAAFDRVYVINALHHFADRAAFFSDALRVLKPGGGLLTVGKDPHAERDSWWVYDYFPETAAIDRERFARVRTLRGEMAAAGFEWAESYECDEIVSSIGAADAFAAGVVDRAYTSQLAVLSDAELAAGIVRIRGANDRAGGTLQLTTDFFLFATIGWKAASAQIDSR